MKSAYWRYSTVLTIGAACVSLIVFVVWQQDARYSLPTPRPADLRQPAIAQPISLDGTLSSAGKPLLLHFFNPACPCSRFNLDHIRGLIRRHRPEIRFVAVLQGNGGPEQVKQAFEKLDLGIDSVVDETGEIGDRVGVYATPQAVLIDVNGRLYYRGNYNISQYCTVRETEFARIAIESMMAGKPPGPGAAAAEIAYGCARKKGSPAKL